MPNFSAILFHPGNTDDDTRGCILTGHVATLTGRFTVGQSRDAYASFYTRVIDAVYAGECWLRIIDDEHPSGITRTEEQAEPAENDLDMLLHEMLASQGVTPLLQMAIAELLRRVKKMEKAMWG